MIVPRIVVTGDPTAATSWIGYAKTLALDCVRLKLVSKIVRPATGIEIRVENQFSSSLKGDGTCKVWIKSITQGVFVYQFITTGTEIDTDGNGYYLGSATAVSLPTATKKLPVVLSGKATGSTLESYGDPARGPTTDLRKITKVKNINQVQLVPESVYYGYYMDGDSYKVHSKLAYASVGPAGRIYNAGLYMLSDHFNISDVGYDLAPTVLRSDNPLGRMPDADWANEACIVRVVSEDYGTRFFVVMADASCTFYCWPDQYDSNDYLDPPDPSYVAQQYKANVPAAQVVSCVPPFPEWVYVPATQRRDTDWPATANSGEPRYSWRFHPLGTKVVGSVLKRTEWTGHVWSTRGDLNTIGRIINPNNDYYFTYPYYNLTTMRVNFYLGTCKAHIKMDVGDIIEWRYVYDFYYKITSPIDTVITGDTAIDLSVSFISSSYIGISQTNNFWYLGHAKECDDGVLSIDPKQKDSRYSGTVDTLHDDAPGWCEFSLNIVITGTDKEDFTFGMTLLDSEEPSDTAYPIAVDYIGVITDPGFSGFGSIDVSAGELVVAYLESYDDRASRVRANTRYGYEGGLSDFVRRSQIVIKNYTGSSTLFTFLTRYQPTEYKYMRWLDPIYAQQVSSTYYPIITLEGKLLEFDLSTLSFVYQCSENYYTLAATKKTVSDSTDFSVYPIYPYGSASSDMRIGQVFLEKQTGTRVYSYGNLVESNTSGSALDVWNQLDSALAEANLDRVLLSKTATRYLSTQWFGVPYFNFYIHCVTSMYVNSHRRIFGGDAIKFTQDNFLPSVTKQNAFHKFEEIQPITYIDRYTEEDITPRFLDEYWRYHWKAYIRWLSVYASNERMHVYVDLYEDFLTDPMLYINETTEEAYLSSCHQDYNATDFIEYDEESETIGQASNVLYDTAKYVAYLMDKCGDNITDSSYFYYFPYFPLSGLGLFNDETYLKNRNIISYCGYLANPGQRLYDYSLGSEWLMDEWVAACPPGPRTRLTNSPVGYYATYFKVPYLNTKTPERILFFHADSDFQMSVDVVFTGNINTYIPGTICNSYWSKTDAPSATDVNFTTFDVVSHPDYPSCESSHQAFYEAGFDKVDGSIDDPVVSVTDNGFYFTYTITVDGQNKNVFDPINSIKMPRLNGSALFVDANK